MANINNSVDLTGETSRLMDESNSQSNSKQSCSKKCNKIKENKSDKTVSILHSLVWPQYDFNKFKKLFEENAEEKNTRYGTCHETLLHRYL